MYSNIYLGLYAYAFDSNEILMHLLVDKAKKTRLKFEIIFITRKSRLIYKIAFLAFEIIMQP